MSRAQSKLKPMDTIDRYMADSEVDEGRVSMLKQTLEQGTPEKNKQSYQEANPDLFIKPTVDEEIEDLEELPEWDKDKLKQFFHQYDWSDNNAGLDEGELLQWMLDVNKDENDPPTVEDALTIIRLYDLTGDEMIQHAEMEAWLVQDALKTAEERNAMKEESDSMRRAIIFMEEMVRTCYDAKNIYNDEIVPLDLDNNEQDLFDTAMMKLRGRGVAREVEEMLKMIDRNSRGLVPTILFKTTMMSSKWHLSALETQAIVKYMSGTARIFDYWEFGELIREKLNDKDEGMKLYKSCFFLLLSFLSSFVAKKKLTLFVSLLSLLISDFPYSQKSFTPKATNDDATRGFRHIKSR